MKELQNLRDLLYNKEEKRFRIAFWISILTPVLSFAAILSNMKTAMLVGGVASTVGAVGSIFLREWAVHLRQKADKCRRLVLYAEALGNPIPKEELATVKNWHLAELEDAPFQEPYYESKKANGPNKLADLTTESSYFTRFLSKRIALHLSIAFCCLLSLLFLILYISVISVSKSSTAAVSPIAIAIISILFTGGIFWHARKYAVLHKVADKTFDTCSKLRSKNDLELFEIWQVVEEYHLALIQSPPILTKYYMKWMDKLNKDYKEAHS